MTKRLVWDYKSMTVEELRAFVRSAAIKERSLTGKYSKARRTHKAARVAAEGELERRGLEP